MNIKDAFGLTKAAAGGAITRKARRELNTNLYKTPSSSTPLTRGSDPISRLFNVVLAAKHIADNDRYAKDFSTPDGYARLAHKLGIAYTRRFDGIPAAKGWGDAYTKKSTYMCMPFVSECFSRAHGGKPLWDKRGGRVALTQDINKALAEDTVLPIDTDNFYAYILSNPDTQPFSIYPRTGWLSAIQDLYTSPYPAAILPGFVKMHNARQADYGGGWGGHAGVTHGAHGTYQASTENGVKNSSYGYWGFAHPAVDKAFTVMGKDVQPEQMARSLHKHVSTYGPKIDLLRPRPIILKTEDDYVDEFKTINATRDPRKGFLLPSFYNRGFTAK